MVIYLFANDDPKELEDALRNQLPNYSFEDTKVIIGTVDTMKSLPTLLMTLYMVVPIIPVYAIILLVRLKVRRKLDGIADKMSHHTRRMHHTLLNALTCQAILPIFYLEAVITFVIQTLGINHKLLEYSVFSMILMIPSLSPVINIYFIRPYRSEIELWIHKIEGLFTKKSTGPMIVEKTYCVYNPKLRHMKWKGAEYQAEGRIKKNSVHNTN